MNLSEVLESIELKIRQLALKVRQLQRHSEALEEENQRLREALSQKELAIARLEDALQKAGQEIQLHKTAESDKTQQLKLQIDQYILEIDKCIDWLSKN